MAKTSRNSKSLKEEKYPFFVWMIALSFSIIAFGLILDTVSGGEVSKLLKKSVSAVKGLPSRVSSKILDVPKTDSQSLKLGATSIPVESAKELEPIVIDNFDRGLTSGVFYQRSTTLGTYLGTWAKRPSYALISKKREHRLGDVGKGLAIDYKKEAGWAGWYILLDGLDASDYNTLSFWVKGEKGGERFDIGLADARMQELEIDAIYAGDINAFLPMGVTTEWQEVKVPMSRVESELNTREMGSVVLWFRYGGQGKIYVDDMMFTVDHEVQAKEEFNIPAAKFDPKYPRSLWVWKIDPVNNKKAREALFNLCDRAAITYIYLYFGEFDPKREKQYSEKLAEFLTEVHKRKIKIEALTGSPSWALESFHNDCLKWVESFLIYNEDRPKHERVDGVSLDVEPYLAAEWTLKPDKIKTEYIQLLEKTRALIDSYNQDFRFGVAIPVFYSDIDGGVFEKNILNLVDYIALMAYHDDHRKVIEKAQPHLEMADELNKKISIGVETQDLISLNQGERRFTFFEEGWENMEKKLSLIKRAFKKYASFEGIAMHCYYSYRLLPRGRNVPLKIRPKKVYEIASAKAKGVVSADGKLDEWDLSRAYVIDKRENVVYGKSAWDGARDLSSTAYSMWDSENLYFAFDITDNKVVQEKTRDQMWEGDHIEFWLDVELEKDYNESVNSNDDIQFGFSPGNFKDLKPEVYVWVPELNIDYKRRVEIGASKTENGYVMEVKIPQDVLYAAIKAETGSGVTLKGMLKSEVPGGLRAGMKLGVSIDPSDCDDKATPQKCMLSSSTKRVWGDPTTFGILRLE